MKDDPTTRPGHDPRRDLLERDEYLKAAEEKRISKTLQKRLKPRRPTVGPRALGRD